MKFSDQEFGKNYLNPKKGHKQLWVGMDTLKRFEKNKTKHPDNFSIKHYTEHPIVYSVNNDFYRTPDDFNSNELGNMYLGCSHTFGTGLYLEDIWAYKLNSIIGGKFWNLGIFGVSFKYMSNHNEISSFIWRVCDDELRGLFKPHEYGDIILPFVYKNVMNKTVFPMLVDFMYKEVVKQVGK